MATNIVEELREDIFTLVNPVTGLTGGLWYIRAETDVYPYATFLFYAGNVTKDSENKYYNMYLQISVFYNGDNADVAETVAHNIIDALDEKEGSITVTGHSCVSIDLITPPRTTKDNYKVWHTYQEYRIRLFNN